MGLGTQIIFGFIAAGIAMHYSGRSRLLMQSIDKAVFGSYGCIPAPAIEQLTLQYFQTRGRAEAIRMILEDNGVPYTEINFNKDEWPEIKKKGIESGTFTFGQGIVTYSLFVEKNSTCLYEYYSIYLELLHCRVVSTAIFFLYLVPAITTKSGISLVQSMGMYE